MARNRVIKPSFWSDDKVGRLTRDVELKYITGTGTPVANFAVAVDREFTGKDGKKETDFIDIQAWGKSAENCANYIGKGSLVGVQGSLRIDTYQNQEGETKKITKVNANRVQFLGTKKNNQINDGNIPNITTSVFQEVDNDDIPF